MPDYPIIRPRRDPAGYTGPKPKVGQTVALCPLCHKYQVFTFLDDNRLACDHCGKKVKREEG